MADLFVLPRPAESFVELKVWPNLKKGRRLGDEGSAHEMAEWEKRDRGGQEAARDGATSRLVKTFQFGKANAFFSQTFALSPAPSFLLPQTLWQEFSLIPLLSD